MKKYALVIDNAITEYPVMEEHIALRGHPLAWYMPVVDIEVASEPGIRKDVEDSKLVVESGVVKRYYGWRPYTLTELLRRFVTDDGKAVSIKDIPSKDVEFAKTLVSEYFEDKLEGRAKALGYQSLNNLLGRYSNSSIPAFKAESQAFQAKLDELWAELLAYFDKLTFGILPVPTTIAEIEAEVKCLNNFTPSASTTSKD